MDNLKNFIETWEATGSIAAVIAKGLSLPPADQAQSYLTSLPSPEQEKARASLTSAMAALTTYAAELGKEAAEIKEQINQTVKTAQACLSYNSADKINRK